MEEQTYRCFTDHGSEITIHACSNCGNYPVPRAITARHTALVCEKCGKHVLDWFPMKALVHEWNRINPIE